MLVSASLLAGCWLTQSEPEADKEDVAVFPDPAEIARKKAAIPGNPVDYYAAILLNPEKSANEREVAAVGLSDSNDPDAIPHLIEGLKDKSIHVRYACAGGLIRMTRTEQFGPDDYAKWKEYWEKHEDRIREGFQPAKATVIEGAKVSNTIGLQLLAWGNFLGARQQFLSATAEVPDNAEYHNNLGLAYMNLHQWEEARGEFQKAIGLDRSLGKREAKPYLNLGECWKREAENALEPKRAEECFAHAEKWFEEAIHNDAVGTYWGTYWRYGTFLLQRGRPDFVLDGKHYKGDAQRALKFLTEADRLCQEAWLKSRARARPTDEDRQEAEKQVPPHLLKDLVIAYYGAGQYWEAWKQRGRLYRLGKDVNPDLKNKLRHMLIKERGMKMEELLDPEERTPNHAP